MRTKIKLTPLAGVRLTTRGVEPELGVMIHMHRVPRSEGWVARHQHPAANPHPYSLRMILRRWRENH